MRQTTPLPQTGSSVNAGQYGTGLGSTTSSERAGPEQLAAQV